MKNKQLTLWIAGGIGILALAGVIFAGGNSDTKKNLAASGTPSFQVDTEMIELGEIDVQGDYPADFTVTNTGDAPLEISKARTSCMCTFAEIIIGDETSPSINMDMYMEGIHTYEEYMAAKKWTGTIQSGESATVRVIYKPYMMPVQGSVARNVKFATNDPNNKSVELGIHATVK